MAFAITDAFCLVLCAREATMCWFEIDARTGEGRATAARLRLNAPLQLEARRQWMRLGLFP